MRRKKLSRRKSGKIFRRGLRVKRKNVDTGIHRGGIHL